MEAAEDARRIALERELVAKTDLDPIDAVQVRKHTVYLDAGLRVNLPAVELLREERQLLGITGKRRAGIRKWEGDLATAPERVANIEHRHPGHDVPVLVAMDDEERMVAVSLGQHLHPGRVVEQCRIPLRLDECGPSRVIDRRQLQRWRNGRDSLR